MKVVVAGSRWYKNRAAVAKKLNEMFPPDQKIELVCGMNSGADMQGYHWAKERGIKIHEFPADWEKHGRAAGPIRNREMAAMADFGVMFWDGNTFGSGTFDMIKSMITAGKPFIIQPIKK